MIADFVFGLEASRALSEFPVSGMTIPEYGLTQSAKIGREQ
jgi:hypothetical protein